MAVVPAIPQKALEPGRGRQRQLEARDVAVHMGPEGVHHRRAVAQGVLHGCDQDRRRGLAVGTGDAHHLQALVGATRELPGGAGESSARVGGHEPGNAGAGIAVGEHGDSAACQRFGEKLAAVMPLPRQGGEHEPGRRRLSAVRHAPQLHIGPAEGAAAAGSQVACLHVRTSLGGMPSRVTRRAAMRPNAGAATSVAQNVAFGSSTQTTTTSDGSGSCR